MGNGYRIITAAAGKTDSENSNTGMYKGGVAILVSEDLQRHIKQIERIGRRIPKIILTGKNATDPNTILATYAPHMGYAVEEQKQHWGLVRETIKQIPTAILCVRCADSNGQLGNRDRTDHRLNKIIGMNTIARTTEQGNGKRLKDICAHHDMIPMAPWRRQPRQTKREHEDISTCVHLCGAVKRQIDYVMVYQKYRNCVRKAHVIQAWRGNQEQRRRAAVKMEICHHLKKQYFTTPNQDK